MMHLLEEDSGRPLSGRQLLSARANLQRTKKEALTRKKYSMTDSVASFSVTENWLKPYKNIDPALSHKVYKVFPVKYKTYWYLLLYFSSYCYKLWAKNKGAIK